MLDMTGGTWIVLEGRDEREDVPLVCIGYKYNKKKTLVFLTTKGAGSIEKRGLVKQDLQASMGTSVCNMFQGCR